MALDVTSAGPVLPVRFPMTRPGLPGQTAGAASRPSVQEGPSFGETLKGYLKEAVELEKEASLQMEGLAQGTATEVHQVMLAVEEANLALDLIIEIRNRLLETYQQLTRTSI